jgi:DNA-directed RNA polymerase subunit RPC12/RpoP
VNPVMKGRTTCPKCKNDFVLDLPQDEKEHEVVCPKCNNKYKIKAKCSDPQSDKECSWEEHGEPRKTVLSSIKPKSNRPMIAAIILIVVFGLGITTAILSEAFIEISLDLASDLGVNFENKLREFDNMVCTIILIIFSVFSLLGTIACLKRKHLDFAYIGSLLGIFSFGFFFIGSILSIIAFVLIRKSKDEFENGKKGRIF